MSDRNVHSQVLDQLVGEVVNHLSNVRQVLPDGRGFVIAITSGLGYAIRLHSGSLAVDRVIYRGETLWGYDKVVARLELSDPKSGSGLVAQLISEDFSRTFEGQA